MMPCGTTVSDKAELSDVSYTQTITITCKYCGSKNVVKNGTKAGYQYYLCRACGHAFSGNDALPGMRFPPDRIASALRLFYEGLSLDKIRRELDSLYHVYPSDSTVYRWVSRFTKRAVKDLNSYKPDVGSIWVADETVLDIDGRKIWFWDMIDAKTRFLVASHISPTRTTKDAQELMRKAYERTGKIPRVIYTDKLSSYLDGIELTFGADTKHRQGSPFDVENNTNLIERFHGTLKARTKIMRGLKDIKSTKLFTDGWLLYYNYLRPHESLENKTPAQEAGVKYPYRNWQDIVAGKRIETASQANATSMTTIPELPDDVEYMVVRKRVIKHPQRQKRRVRQAVQTALAGVKV